MLAAMHQIDLEDGVWNAPASIIKKKRDHRFPLSPMVIELLRSLPRTGKKGEKVFKLSNMAMLELLRGMAGNGYTVYGFRSAFKDWAHDRTGYDRDVIDGLGPRHQGTRARRPTSAVMLSTSGGG
jgi:integrase